MVAVPFLIVALLVLWPARASAQRLCGDHTDFVRQLENDHLELRYDMALSGGGQLFEVFRGGEEDAPTWTLLVTYADGLTCVVATGETWEHYEIPTSLSSGT